MRTFLLAIVASLGFALSPALAAPAKPKAALSDVKIDSLAIKVVETDSEFTLIDSRMDETGTAAVFFGVIGAAINSADNASEDTKKAAPLQSTAAALDLDTIIRDAIYARLAAKQAVPLAESADKASTILLVEIGEWGLVRKAQKPDKDMRTFLKMNISLTDQRGRALWGPQREHSIGQFTSELPAFTPEIFKTEMEALAKRAGEQVANELNYR